MTLPPLASSSARALRSVLAGDVAQALGQLAEGDSNLDPLAGAGAAVELAVAGRAVLALDRGARLDVAQALLAMLAAAVPVAAQRRSRRSRWTSPRRCSRGRRP